MRCIAPPEHAETAPADRVRLQTPMHRLWFTVSDSFYKLRTSHPRSTNDRGGRVRLFRSDQLPWVVKQYLLTTSDIACCRPTCESLSLA
jgi:hypothetical protein